ncbi:MAG TPA: YggS family pyridoxal phosphate-dependent enzyme, partial [Candidatus Cloacimonadota bacterium]|nr:YggS family pyridoxal phosphate-dependent enzyme [Candidatus Cloacimonadota bacterium]
PMITSPYRGFHFIGHLQTNKINQLLSLKPLLIHSIDSVYLAEKLHLALGRTNRTQDILIQVNTTREEQKSGVTFENARDTIWRIAAYSTLKIKGLMTIGKLHPNPEISRPYFKQLKELFDEFQKADIPSMEMQHLSMGMSHDWKIAVEEGSNMIRIGSAIFGERHYGDDI